MCGPSRLFEQASRVSRAARDRGIGAALAIPSVAVLGVAAWLTPSPQGYGTHQQLGLGGCSFLALTGWPCPMCGMTTTFAWMAHGYPVEALRSQPFGVVLFTLTAAAGLVGSLDLAMGRGYARRGAARLEPHEGRLAAAFLAAMALGWLYKCALLHPEILGRFAAVSGLSP